MVLGRLPREEDSSITSSVRVLAALFFLSGLCSLVYELVWARLLALYLGNTTIAHTLVISTFMGGLGIGYAYFGRVVDRLRRPLLFWAILELGISIWALLFSGVLDLGARWALPLMISMGPASTGAAILGLLVSAVVLLVPTFLMGGTLPLLVRVVTQRDQAPGQAIAWLYALNSFGAALGVLLSGFWLIEQFGLSGATVIAVIANLVVAAGAYLLSRSEADPDPVEDAGQPWEEDLAGLSASQVRLALIAAGLFGFVSLALQGLWIRLFSVILGSSTYSFSLVIAAFIAGIAAGSAVTRALLRRYAVPYGAIAGVALAVGLVLLVTGPVYGRIPYDILRLKLHFQEFGYSFYSYAAIKFGLVFAFLLIPTAGFGMALPLCARAVVGRQVGAGTGRVFAVNTLGSVLGAALSVPILVPWLGLAGAFQAATIMLTLLALALYSIGSTWSPRRAIGAGVFLAATVASVFVSPGWDPIVISSGSFLRTESVTAESFQDYVSQLHEEDLIFYEDGRDASVTVLQKGTRVVPGLGPELSLKVNGKADAGTRGDMLTQVGCAHVPLLLHPAPSEVLVVGLGSGVTAGSATTHGSNVDVIELSPAVVRGARLFHQANRAALDHPRVRVYEDDARSFLQLSDKKWDVIISEPSNPWMAGNAGLFTREFFDTLRDHLREGGILAQWFHLYEMDDATVRLVVRTLRESFPYVAIWELFPNDILMVATLNPISPDFESMVRRLRQPAVAEDLARVWVKSVPGLLSLQKMDYANVEDYIDGFDAVNTDSYPTLEFTAPRRLYQRESAGELASRDARGSDRYRSLLGRWIQERELSITEAQDLMLLHSIYRAAPNAFRMKMIPRFLRESDSQFLTDLLTTLQFGGEWKDADLVANRLLEIDPDSPRTLFNVSSFALKSISRDEPMASVPTVDDAVALLQRCAALGDDQSRNCTSLLYRLAGATN